MSVQSAEPPARRPCHGPCSPAALPARTLALLAALALLGAALAPLAAPAMLGALGEPRCAEMRRFALAGYVVARRKARELCARVEDGAIAVRLDIDAGEQVAAARFAALLEGRWDQDGPEE